AAVLFKNFACAQHSLFLILQAFESVRYVNVFQFSRTIEFITEVFVEKLQIELVWREVRERRTICNRIVVRLSKIDGDFPQFVEFRESKFIVSTCLKFDVEFKIIEKARLR